MAFAPGLSAGLWVIGLIRDNDNGIALLFRESSSIHIFLAHPCTCQDSPSQVGTEQVCVTQIGASQGCTAQISLAQVRRSHTSVTQISTI